eukprot:scaffold89860_cov35-Tisochrysis_lutea.AAC.2
MATNHKISGSGEIHGERWRLVCRLMLQLITHSLLAIAHARLEQAPSYPNASKLATIPLLSVVLHVKRRHTSRTEV